MLRLPCPLGLRQLSLSFAAILGVTSPAAAQVPDATWKTFVEYSRSEYRPGTEPDGFDQHLYREASRRGRQTDAIAEFSARIGVPRDVGADYAAVIVETVGRRRRGCVEPCEFLPGGPFYDQVARLAAAEPTGQLLIAIGANLDSTSRLHDRGWIALALRHPAAATVLERVYERMGEVHLVMAMFAATDPNGWNPASIASAASPRDEGPDNWDGWLDAFIAVAERRARESGAPVAVRAALAQLSISRELQLGLIANAARRYLTYPPEILARLPVAGRWDDACRQAEGYAFTDDLAAALFQTGHVAEARTMLREEFATLGRRGQRARSRLAALADMFDPTVPAADLFDRYLITPGGGPRDSCGPDVIGWLDVVDTSPSMRRLAATRLRLAGYADMGAALESGGLYARDTAQAGWLSGYARFFPDTIRSVQAQLAMAIDEAWRTTFRGATSQTAVQVTGPAAMPSWPERRLPPNVRAWRDRDRPARPPRTLLLPVDPDAVLRYETVGREHAIVYESSDYDLPGEVPAFGVWFTQTELGRWTRPVYLGLRQYFPYVITPGSRLPLLKDDVLQLEVQIREIDPGSIIFPPLATDLLRSVDGLYLTIDLARARADYDDDGLSDIEERALGLDPTDADSDGDGVPDGSDAVPLTAHRPDAAPAELAVARAVISQIMGHDHEALVTGPVSNAAGGLTTTHTRSGALFLVADPRIFAGISLAPARLIVYTDADLRALARGPAPFYPPSIARLFSSLDGLRHYVQWSANWTGGRFVVICSAGGGACAIQELLSWVT